jgi:hypothetical protein
MKQKHVLIIALSIFLFSKASLAQSDNTDIPTRLAAYLQAQQPEKLFLHTDKSYYTAGDVIWFKVYAVDGGSHKPIHDSKVAYIELLDKNNTPVSRVKVMLDEKGGNGSIQLSLNLASGYYTVRAYTSWMKNLGADHFFEKAIAVVNPLKSPEAQPQKQSSNYTLKLFPEGGNMVSGLPSKVVFHLTDQYNAGVSATGYLLNSKKDTLGTMVPYKFGMGHFDITPLSGETYQVVFKLSDGKTVSENLPKSYESGYVMQLEEHENDRVKITVRTNGGEGYPELFLLVQNRQKVKAFQKSSITNNTAIFFIEKDKLEQGISQFTIFDQSKKPVCERLYFVQPVLQTALSLKTYKEAYGTRERVDVAVDNALKNGENLSLSVYQLDVLQTKETATIYQYLWLGSELNGPIEEPDYYFSVRNDSVKKAADYLMLTHGWRRFDWESILKQSPILRFPKETYGQLITAKVSDTRNGAMAKDIQVFLSIPSSSQKLFSAISDSNGIVRFDIKELYGKNEFIIQTDWKKDSFFKVELLSPFMDSFSNRKHSSLSLNHSHHASLVDRSISIQSQYIYLRDSIFRVFRPVLSDTLPFYGKPTRSYKLDDYKRFTTMEEVLREYVLEVNVSAKSEASTLRFKLLNDAKRRFYTEDILVMVDGIPLNNTNQVFSFDPLKIKQLDIINNTYILGSSVFYGVANFLSYNSQFEGIELDPKAVTIDYDGLQMQRQFYSPDYSSNSSRLSRIPDLRNTLFWLPNMDAKPMHFYTGDNKGKYLVVLQGIDRNGNALFTSSSFEVK